MIYIEILSFTYQSRQKSARNCDNTFKTTAKKFARSTAEFKTISLNLIDPFRRSWFAL